NTADVPPADTTRTTGFVIVCITASGASLIKFVEYLPTESIDLSDGTDFSAFDTRAIYEGALFSRRPGQSDGWSKYVVNAGGALEDVGFIATIDVNPFRLSVRDATTGIFQDLANANQLTVFNPTTFQITNTIDMKEGFVPGDAAHRYIQFYFREDDVFAPIDGGNEPFSSFVIHQAELGTTRFEGSTQRDGNGTSDISNFTNYLHFGNVDEQGNLYIPDGGNYEGAGIPGRINKIPAGSNEIDTDYVFEPAVVLDPENTFLPTFSHFYVLENGKAIARVNAETPQHAIDIVMEAGGVANLSPTQEQEILGILFSAASARWCLLDLNAKSVTPILGIPFVPVFTRRDIFEYEGNYYLPVVTENENAYYRYDLTGSAEKAFDVTGADIVGVYNLANNSQ
ncbi:MAG: hypothetical protein ACFB0B_20170, partial [Thermonemataceae bacterium]